eukprot:1790841-Rhodomonas_salina.1
MGASSRAAAFRGSRGFFSTPHHHRWGGPRPLLTASAAPSQVEGACAGLLSTGRRAGRPAGNSLRSGPGC